MNNKVLIEEDNKFVSQVIATFFCQAGYQTKIAYDGNHRYEFFEH